MIKFSLPLILLIFSLQTAFSQESIVKSPDGRISVKIINGETLMYEVRFGDLEIIKPSPMGFEFKGEKPVKGGFRIIGETVSQVDETWKPVVNSKHSVITDRHNELHIILKEKSDLLREINLFVRAFDDGIAFRYGLSRSEKIGAREITKELTGFNIPGDPKCWVVEYNGYSSSNEAEFFERKLSYVNEKTIAGMPFLVEYDNGIWVAISEAKIDNYPAFYIGTNGNPGQLVTKLVPLPGEQENGVKARAEDEIATPWRVILIGENPGKLIESEIIQNLNDPCAISDPSWIRPGMCAWDHWWSGEVKMEMPVIKQYIDMASEMGWPYMLVDWQWYGKFNTPSADITKWAPQIDMPEIIKYAGSKNVKIIVWLYSSDVNREAAYKRAFPIYHKWGIAGVKIDFMDRDDQYMVSWYHNIIKCAADNKLLVDFHGAYKPDGIIRTWPNMITREGVMGNEYYKFSDKMSPEHNVKLAFTRMLAGQMDYTPGAFLNVTREQFKRQTPAIVWNTRAAELSKFVVYESPLTVVCDHPDNILGKQGSDFLKLVPTTWDDVKFLGGYPGDYVAMARRSGNTWFLGVMNNSKRKEVTIDPAFLGEGNWVAETWSDTKKSDKEPSDLKKSVQQIKKGSVIKVQMADNGGLTAIIRKE